MRRAKLMAAIRARTTTLAHHAVRLDAVEAGGTNIVRDRNGNAPHEVREREAAMNEIAELRISLDRLEELCRV